MPEEKRPAAPADWHRVDVVLRALRLKADSGTDDRELWAIIRDLHAELEPPRGVDPPDPDTLVGDRAAAREVQWAEIVVESMMIRDGMVPVVQHGPVYTVCEVYDCPEMTYSGRCPSHELFGDSGREAPA